MQKPAWICANKLQTGLDGLRFCVVSRFQQVAAPCFVRVKKIGPYEYFYLVENVREGGRHVQRVIKALGRRDAETPTCSTD